MTEDTFMMIIFPTITLLMGLICGMLTKKQINTWYKTIKKPRFTPPNWIMSPVWSILYITIGVSGYLIWKENGNFFDKKFLTAWIIYLTQLLMNYSWVFLFFIFHRLLLSLILIIFLNIFITMNLVVFFSISKISGEILIPYLVWVLISTYYNFNIWRLNRFYYSEGKELKSLVEI